MGGSDNSLPCGRLVIRLERIEKPSGMVAVKVDDAYDTQSKRYFADRRTVDVAGSACSTVCADNGALGSDAPNHTFGG
jgi:hypothetical protein